MVIKDNVWKEFACFKDTCRKNRVFPECRFISNLISQLPKAEITVNGGSTFYRARVFKNNFPDLYFEQNEKPMQEEEKIFQQMYEVYSGLDKVKAQREAGFRGYDEVGSFVCPNIESILPGRCNHVNEQCLYLAEDVQTAISEIKPLIREKISVACIEAKEALKIIDFSFDRSEIPILKLVAFLFLTSPTLEEYDVYTYTQIICSLVKKEGYDGIKYTSCQNLGKSNYAIFSFEKCKAISSDVYEVDSITYRYTPK